MIDELSDIDTLQFQGTLGRGAFGIVVKALNKTTNQIVAVKVIKKKQVSQCAQLLEEAIILQDLSHPNIVKFHAVYESDTKIFIEMELIEGGSLSSLHKCSEEQAKYITYSILSALSYMHDNNIVHRDLKPENVLISCDLSKVKVTDFGLSTTYSSLMIKQCGTLTYMAPEQLNNRLYNKSIDIWAVGVIFYQLLIGEHPYYRKGCDIAQSQLEMHQKCKSLLNDIQFSLFRRLTDLDPSKRYSATQALLHPWFNNGSEEPITMEEQFQRWKQTMKLHNIMISLMMLAKMGYKKKLLNKNLYDTISKQHIQDKKQDFQINYEDLFADYQQSLTDAQKIKVSYNTSTNKVELIKMKQIPHSTLSNQLLTNIKQKFPLSLNPTPMVMENNQQEQIIIIPSSNQLIQETQSITQSECDHQQLTTTNTTTSSPNKSPLKKKRVKRANIRGIINTDIVTNNIMQINQINSNHQITPITQINTIGPIKQPTTVPPIGIVNRNRESPTIYNNNKFKIQLKPLNHQPQMTNSQHVASFRPRGQPTDKQIFAPPVVDLNNLALDCMSPQQRKQRAKSLHTNQRRVYANEFQPSRILAGSYKRNYESFYVQ